ncbi:MAG: hypothetical protein MKZ54_06230 [Candidatus Poseidoniaceae archaeon]|nr:hypothetical protein [Candidatus Poseidoniaceae archaeon]
MDKRAKITIFIGLGIFLMGVVGMIIGAAGIGGVEEEWNNFALEDVTNGTVTIEDNDGIGDVGVTFWVKGEYVDDAENGLWEVCEQVGIRVTEKPEVTEPWATGAYEIEGECYSEVLYDLDKEGTSSCESDYRNKNNEREANGLVKIGRACYGCLAGDFTFESNGSVWVTYDDAIGEEIAGEVGLIVLGFFGGSGALCCGVVVMLIGLILIFTLNDDAPVQMHVGADGSYVLNPTSENTVGVGINQSIPQVSTPSVITEEMTKAEPYQFPSTDESVETEEKTIAE